MSHQQVSCGDALSYQLENKFMSHVRGPSIKFPDYAASTIC